MRTRYILEWEEYDGCATDKGTTCDDLDELHSALAFLMSEQSEDVDPSTIHAYEIIDGQVVEMMQWLYTLAYSFPVNVNYQDMLRGIEQADAISSSFEIHKRIADGMDWTIVKDQELEALKKEALDND